ncbi:uncharacterized protein QIL1 [Centruroides vittatus]|uniref:uncharacterized protein QIL1 n=1 Tax=Centruroides vittatus TaxID=120091 RepID=UPI00350EAADA
MKIIKNILKLGIASGAVYVTVDQGIWSDNKTSAKALQVLQSYYEMIPGINSYKLELFKKNEFSQKTAEYWNSGVKYCFSGLAQLPTTICSGIQAGVTMSKDFIQDGKSK